MPLDNRTAYICARLTASQRAAITRAAKACNESISDFMRTALAARASGKTGASNEASIAQARLRCSPARQALKQLAALAAKDPKAQIADLCLALGIPAASSSDAILEAVTALLDTLDLAAPSAADDPLQQSAETPAALSWARLSTADRARAAQRGIHSAAQFAAAKNKFRRA